MGRMPVAVIVSCIWLVAAVAAGAILIFAGITPLHLLVAIGFLASAFIAASVVGMLAQARADARLLHMAEAGGVTMSGHDRPGAEQIIGGLIVRIGRLTPYRTAFSALTPAAALLAADGRILAMSDGMGRLVPRATEGELLAPCLGGGFNFPVAEGQSTIAVVGAQRFRVSRRPVGGGRMLVELHAAAQTIAEDDLAAFAEALASGRTGFRFDPAAVEASEGLKVLDETLELFDEVMCGMTALTVGDAPDAALLRRNSGFGPVFRTLRDGLAEAQAERDAQGEVRRFYERKLEAVARAIDGYRGAARRTGELSESTRKGLRLVDAALARAREKSRVMRRLEARARGLGGDAVAIAIQASLALEGSDEMTEALDAFAATIEEVSLRTNMLALDAAVQAARAESGGRFGAVAEEIRVLAQASQNTAQDVRVFVAEARQRNGGRGSAAVLKEILSELEGNLRNLSNSAEMIVGAVEEGGRALSRAGTDIDAIDGQVRRSLAMPQHTARAA